MLRTDHAVGTGSMPKNPTIAIAIAIAAWKCLKMVDFDGTSVTSAVSTLLTSRGVEVRR